MKDIVFPTPLRKGDTVALLSPASSVKEEYVSGAARTLEAYGYRPLLMPHVNGPADGAYAADLRSRTDDFITALCDPDVKAILCSRGGYGAMQMFPEIPASLIRNNPKWIAGFSDISAIHALMLSNGIASIHSPMAKYLDECGEKGKKPALFDYWGEESVFTVSAPVREENIPGEAQGRLLGGNLAVLSGLAGTPWDILAPDEDAIIFLEDVGEALYRIDRMMWRLYMSGTLSRAKALIFGSFTEYHKDANFPDAETMISCRLREWGLDSKPVCFGFPVGHTDNNIPLIQGAAASLEITPRSVNLKMDKL